MYKEENRNVFCSISLYCAYELENVHYGLDSSRQSATILCVNELYRFKRVYSSNGLKSDGDRSERAHFRLCHSVFLRFAKNYDCVDWLLKC